ncbi:MAG: FAD-binding oxidoreductase [Patescibacteria group bacterium]
MELAEELKSFFTGDILHDAETIKKYSRDASLFEITPELVVFPKDVADLKNLVRFAAEKKKEGRKISLTARSAGTDMSGGSIGESIIVVFTKYFTHTGEVEEGTLRSEPGVYYRDFEKITLEKGYLFPSYPASKELCAIGGIVNNNAGGERSLVYGKTEDYIASMNVVLADGNEYTLRGLSREELDEKLSEPGFEGEVYRKMYKLLEENYDVVKAAKPKVSKNSAGFNVWDVWDKKEFNLAKLFVGSQGTLGLTTEATFRLVKTKPYSGMLVVFMKDLRPLVDLVKTILPFAPTSFESFDDHTLRLAMRFLPDFIKLLGSKNIISLGLQFLPEFWLVLTEGMPKLVLLVEFEGDTQAQVDEKITALRKQLKNFRVKVRVAGTKEEAKKYWAIRRESFNLLRHRVLNKQTAPFIDDVIVAPEKMPEFLTELYKILDRYKLLYTIAGHVGNGNFHIIPLMSLAKDEDRQKIPLVADEVYDLTLKYGGSITAEHNDGLIRGPYLKKMYGAKVYGIFKEIKSIFDPEDIFNPGKKMEADLQYALAHIKRS